MPSQGECKFLDKFVNVKGTEEVKQPLGEFVQKQQKLAEIPTVGERTPPHGRRIVSKGRRSECDTQSYPLQQVSGRWDHAVPGKAIVVRKHNLEKSAEIAAESLLPAGE